MAKTLCDWSRKDIAKRADLLAGILADPSFVCAKCARCANSKKALCSPRKLAFAETLPFDPAAKKKSPAA